MSWILVLIPLVLASPLPADPYAVTEVTAPATLEGRVRLAGPPPDAAPLDAGRSPGSCDGAKPDESWVLGPEGGVANVVVSLEKISAGKPWPEVPSPVLDQQGCVFVPHVVTAPTGALLEVRNSDQVFHNVHAYTWSGKYTPFNLAMPPGAAPVRQPLERPGILSLRCDAGHRWMSGYVHVGRTPYHAMTGRDGRFRITGIPPGVHEVSVWHERFGLEEFPVSFGPSAITTLELEAFSGPDRLEAPPRVR